MFSKHFKFAAVLFVLAVCQTQVSHAQFYQQQQQPFIRNVPRHGSVSKASSNAYEREIDYGNVGVSRGVANSKVVTKSNGGFRNGGVTSVAKSNAQSREVNLGGLEIGSTLTRSQTNTNGVVSRGVAHDLNIGSLDIGTSLSRDNLRNGFGLQRSPDGGVQFGLGPLSFDLSRNQQQPDANAYTQAQAQGNRARANSNAGSQTKNYGKLGVTDSFSTSNAVSRSRYGQTSAATNGIGGGVATNGLTYGQNLRVRREPIAQASNPPHIINPVYVNPQKSHGRPKRKAQFIPFAYPGSELDRPRRQFGRPNFGFQQSGFGYRQPGFGYQQPGFGYQQAGFGRPQRQNSNAQGLANNKNNRFEQQAAANTQTNEEINENGLFQNNDASSIGSNFALDGSSGQLSSANVNQMNSVTKDSSQSTNNAQSQALNFEPNQQQAASSNAGTNKVTDANGGRFEANGGAQTTNTNEFGSSSNIANTNSAVFKDGNTSGSSADSSSQSIFQGNNGDNASAQTDSKVSSQQDANGVIRNSASSNASAVSQGGQSANAVATASSSSNRNGGNAFTNANSNVGGGFGGVQSNGGAFGNFGGAQGFANGQGGGFRRANKQLKYSYPPQRQQNQTSSTVAILNDSSEINWPQNRIQHHNHYPQQQQQQQQQLHHSSITPNTTTEQFDVIDENERHGRTFSLITDLINRFTQPTCVYPCTMEAYQQRRCCEPPPTVCCQQQQPMPLPPSPIRPVPPLYPPPPPLGPPPQRPPVVVIPPIPTYPLIPTQCCNTCPSYGYYGPPPCIRYSFPGGGTGRVTLYIPPSILG